jgi:predicted dehydrogenase
VNAATPQAIGVAVIGFGWMGRVHARAYARVRHHFPELPLSPVLVTVADNEPDRREDAVRRFQPQDTTADWQDVLTDERVHAVSVTVPNFLHREIGAAVVSAGKHLWIEKPVGLRADDARAVAEAVASAQVQSTVGFNYRHAPAVEHAKQLIASGELGRITNADLLLMADYAAHPYGALSWRFERDLGGSGVLGDLASHGVDLARYLVGEITDLVADTATFIKQRPVPSGAGGHFEIAEGGEFGAVENEDYVGCLVRFAGGARGSVRSSRVSVGDQSTYGFTVHGTKGFVSWDFRRLGELVVSAGGDYLNQTASTLYVGPGSGELAAFQPGAGIAMGYDDLKVVEAARFLASIADGKPRGATIADAVASAAVLDAMAESVLARRWVAVALPSG